MIYKSSTGRFVADNKDGVRVEWPSFGLQDKVRQGMRHVDCDHQRECECSLAHTLTFLLLTGLGRSDGLEENLALLKRCQCLAIQRL